MRIIAGTAKGHIIKAPKGMDTRPTLDRVRESVFNVLAHRGLVQKRVLDLFSGTGALAIESLSRGASHAVAMDKATAKLIKENAEHCHVADKITIFSNTLTQVAHRLEGQQFDYIFSDPPYQKGFIEATIKFVIDGDFLAPEGVLLLERHKDEALVLPEGWACIKEQKFGYTLVSYCVRNSSERS